MKSLASLILLTVLFTACSIEQRFERKLRRAERKIEKLTLKYPQLLQKDTLRDTLTVKIPSIYHDTAFVPADGDTVIIEKDRLRVQYITRNDSVFIQGECIGDTIIREIKIPVDRVVVRKQSLLESFALAIRHLGIWIILILLLGAAALFVIKFWKPF